MLLWIVLRLPETQVEEQFADDWTRGLALVSLFYPAYYLTVSWWITWRIVRRARLRSVKAVSVDTH